MKHNFYIHCYQSKAPIEKCDCGGTALESCYSCFTPICANCIDSFDGYTWDDIRIIYCLPCNEEKEKEW